MTTSNESERVDFFISYTSSDENWATWIAWVLENAGVTVVLQAWDFRPGSNFVLEMQSAAQRAQRTIAVINPEYLRSRFTQPEWAAAFGDDPSGLRRQLVPVVVESCDIEGMLGKVVHINLVGLASEEAEEKLLAGLQPGRAKPLKPPTFPGFGRVPGSESGTPVASNPRVPSLGFQPLGQQPEVVWRSDLSRDYASVGSAATTLELHMVPSTPSLIEARTLNSMRDDLTTLGRTRGFFTPGQAVASFGNASASVANGEADRETGSSGLYVTREGQRSLWFTLPNDMMGSVYDAAEVESRLGSLLDLLESIPIHKPERVCFALALEPITMMMVGDASAVGRRSSASLPYTSQRHIRVEPSDDISFDAVTSNLDATAQELAARLSLTMTPG